MHRRVDFLAQDLLGALDGQRGHLLAQGFAGAHHLLLGIGLGSGNDLVGFLGGAHLGFLDDLLRAALGDQKLNFFGASYGTFLGATFADQFPKRVGRFILDGAIDPSLDEGVYCQFRGPHYETPAEVRMAGILGGTLVGMSTTLETIAAREAGMEVLGISLVTNLAAGISPEPLDHKEVLEMGAAAGPRLAALVKGILEAI